MKQRYSGLHVLLSLAGSADGGFGPAVSSRSRINRLVHNCMTLMRRTYPGVFDGIDIDWEFPSNAVERGNFTRVVKAFRRALGRAAPLTIAAGTDPGMVKWIDWKAVTPQLSWINLMTYDFHGPWGGDPVTNFNSPLRGDPRDPGFHLGYWTAHAVTMMRTRLHVPAGRIMVGIPFYGRGYAQVPPKNHGLYQKYQGATPYGTAPGVFSYRDIVRRYVNRNGFKRYGPNLASTEPWLYSSKRHAFISYDDVSTMAAKAAYITRSHLGGAMIWDLAFDTTSPKTSLTDALHRYLLTR